MSSFLCCPSSRIAVFSITVFYDERIVIVAEQRPDASEEDSFQWMSRVLQVIFKLLLYSYYTTFSVSWCSQLIFHSYKTIIFFLSRPSIASTKLAFTASHLSQPTLFQRHLWEGSISAKPSRIFWREICTPVISLCARTHVSPISPSLARNSQVGWLRLYLLFPNPGNCAHYSHLDDECICIMFGYNQH